jgi:hypothetical protein
MKKIIITLSIVSILYACNSKNENKSTNTTNSSTNTTDTTLGATTNSVKGSVSEQVESKALIEAKASLEKKELTPTEVLKQMNTVGRTAGILGIKAAMCNKDAAYMDSTIMLLSKMEKALDTTFMDMMNEMFQSKIVDETNVEYKNEKINGNTATVDAFDKKSKQSRKIQFIKENDVWKVCEDMMSTTSKDGVNPLDGMKNMISKFETMNPQQKAMWRRISSN